jgi:hypothetical protein
VAKREGLTVPAEIVHHVIAGIRQRFKADLACYQPRFITDQVLAACKFMGVPASFAMDVVEDALANLYPRVSTASHGVGIKPKAALTEPVAAE